MVQYLSDSEIHKIAIKLLSLLGNDPKIGTEANPDKLRIDYNPIPSILERARVSSVARSASKAYETRRRRDLVFGQPELFGEPAWEMLLDLSIAEEEGQRLSITSACIGSCAPPSTALRYIKAMEESGLVARVGDITDARRTYVRLTKDGTKRVSAALADN